MSLGFGFALPSLTPPSVGGGGGPTLAGLVYVLDAKLYSSGQTWANSVAVPADGSPQTSYDYFLGSSSSPAADDPTITNSGGDAAYWLFNGSQFFTETLAAASMPAFLQTMHHAGKKWTIEIWMQWAGILGGNVNPVFDSGTSDRGGSDVARGVIFVDLSGFVQTGGKILLRVKRDSAAQNAWVRQSDADLPSNSPQMVAVSWDASGADPSFFYRNGSYAASSGDGTAGDTWTVSGATFGTENASNSSRIGARGDAAFSVPNNTRVYLMRVYNRNLSKAEMDTNWDSTKARFGL